MFYFETDSSIILTDFFRRCATWVLVCVFGFTISSMEMESRLPRHAQFQSSLSLLQNQKISTRQLPERVSSCFLLLLPNSRSYSVPLLAGLFHNLLLFERPFNRPNDLRPAAASLYKHSCTLSVGSFCIAGMLDAIGQTRWHSFGYLLTPTLNMLISPSTNLHVFLLFALLRYIFLRLSLNFKS